MQPQTGEFLAIFQDATSIVFAMFISLFFDLLYQRGYQKGKNFWRLNEKVSAYEAATA